MLKSSELILESSARVTEQDGKTYRPIVVGEQQAGGAWHGRIEFHPLLGGRVRSTGRETTQVSRGALEYWASGLEAVYFDGAFDRAM